MRPSRELSHAMDWRRQRPGWRARWQSGYRLVGPSAACGLCPPSRRWPAWKSVPRSAIPQVLPGPCLGVSILPSHMLQNGSSISWLPTCHHVDIQLVWYLLSPTSVHLGSVIWAAKLTSLALGRAHLFQAAWTVHCLSSYNLVCKFLI